jgi:phage baseplate assembly protein gpV
MSNILSDGTCIPSYLGSRSRGVGGGSRVALNDSVLHLGEIKKVIWPDDKNSYTKTTVEYEVEVQYRSGSGGYVSSTFRGATLSNVFGGNADQMRATLRPGKGDSDKAMGAGSKVLLLCIGGDQQKAIILGGVRDPNSKLVESKDDGHHLFFEFNGAQFSVDKDGQAQFLFRGATKVDGTLTDSAVTEAEGTSVLLDKDGGFTVGTPDLAQYIKIDHKNKKIEILSDDDFHVTSNGKVTVEAQGDVSVSTKGSATITAQGTISEKSAGVLIGDATDATMKGTTYRAAEQALHSQLASGLTALGPLLATVAGAMTAAALLNPPLGPAAVPLTAASVLMGQLAGAIQAFEGQAQLFLSTKNKSD